MRPLQSLAFSSGCLGSVFLVAVLLLLVLLPPPLLSPRSQSPLSSSPPFVILRLRFSLSSLLRWFNYSSRLRCQAFFPLPSCLFGPSAGFSFPRCSGRLPRYTLETIDFLSNRKNKKKQKPTPKSFLPRKRQVKRQVLSVKTVFILPFTCEGNHGRSYSTDSVCL